MWDPIGELDKEAMADLERVWGPRPSERDEIHFELDGDPCARLYIHISDGLRMMDRHDTYIKWITRSREGFWSACSAFVDEE